MNARAERKQQYAAGAATGSREKSHGDSPAALVGGGATNYNRRLSQAPKRRHLYHHNMLNRFRSDVLANQNNRAILDRWSALALPDGWLVAGCLFQTIWNLQAGRPPEENIKDYDLFYFDKADLSAIAERQVQAHVDEVLADLGISVEVCNQARVHVWYQAHFGHPYDALQSACDGIDRFLIPATCVGIHPDAIYAPNGLERIYEGELTINTLTPYLDLFEQKAASYRARWPALRITRPA